MTASGSPTPQPGHKAVSSGTVAKGGAEIFVQDAEGATHTDGHAGWCRTLLPGYKQVLHLHLALQLCGREASVVDFEANLLSVTVFTEFSLPTAWSTFLTFSLCHLDF